MKAMSLTRFELYKLFSRRSIWIILGLLIFALYLPLQLINLPSGPQPSFQPTPPSAQQVRQAKRDQIKVTDKLKSVTPNTTEYWTLSFQRQQDQNILDASRGSAVLGQLMDAKRSMSVDLKKHGKASFAYRLDHLEYNMLRALPFVGTGQYLGVGMQVTVFFSLFGAVIFGAMILIGLSSVFSEEYGIGTDSFLLTTKRGQRELAIAKILASAIYVTVMEAILTVVNLVSNIAMYGTKGFNYPVQSLQYATTFHLSIAQYCVVASVMQLIAGLAFGVLVLLFSALNRSSVVSLFISGGILILPMFISKAVSAPWGQALQSFSYVNLLQVGGLFESFDAMNLFGYPVLYPFAVTAVIILISIPVVWLVFWGYRRHQVA